MSAGYRPDIDGLRAIAVTSVVFYHAHLAWLGGGFVGVDIFFVISGFLITSIIRQELDAGRFSFARFYARRMRRILPALFAMIAASYVLAHLILSPVELRNLAGSIAAATFGASNILFAFSEDYFADDAVYRPMLMTWSLGVEEQFYLVLPLLLWAVTIWRRAWRTALVLAVVVVSFGLGVWATQTRPAAAFYLLPFRAWELGVGCLAALWWPRLQLMVADRRLADGLSLLGAAMIGLAVVTFRSSMPFPGTAALLPVTGALLLIVTPAGIVNRRLLSLRPLVFVGLLSYSWYLWHWPVMSFARISSSRPLDPSVTTLLGLATLPLAYLSWRFVEQPFRRPGTAIGRTLVQGTAASLLVVAPALVAIVMGGWPARFAPAVRTEEAAARTLAREPCLVRRGETPLRVANCIPPVDDGVTKAALVGDSHAASLRTAFETIARDDGLVPAYWLRTGCPPLLGVVFHKPTRPNHGGNCHEFMATAIAEVAARSDVDTVVLAGYWSAPFAEIGEGYLLVGQSPDQLDRASTLANLETGLDATVATLVAGGKHVVLVKGVPNLGFHPIRQRLSDEIGLRRAIGSTLAGHFPGTTEFVREHDLADEDDATNAVVARVGARHPGVEVIQPATGLCHDGACRYADAGRLLYFDETHLTALGGYRALAGLHLDQSSVLD